MGTIMLNGIAYGGDNFFRLTQAEYDALTPYEQTHGNYCITDAGATGDLAGNYVTYTSGDVADVDATSWSTVQPMESREGFAGLFNKISTMAKNVRYLKNLLNDNVWQDVTSEFTKNVTGARTMILFNKFTNEIKIQLVGGGVSTGTVWLTAPSKYAPNTSLMSPSSGTQYYMQGISIGRYTQSPGTPSDVNAFVGTPIYDSSTGQIKINFPINATAYAIQSDIRYIVA